MPAPPRLLIVAGTRSDILHVAPFLEETGRYERYALPFETRLLVTRQEDTELDQALVACGLTADDDLGIKSPRLADAALGAKLLECMEQSLRHHAPSAVMAVGYSASAWATAVACYFKHLPFIHLGAGEVSPDVDAPVRPFPEWMHAREMAGQTALHLACDETAAAELAGRVPAGAQVDVVGHGPDALLARALEQAAEEDPALEGIAPEQERVLVFLRRREHHANASRPLCMALNAASRAFPDTFFFCPFSLQSHICDALESLIEPCDNLRATAPLPFPAFAREVARSRLVLTDSNGVAREALLLGRPTILLGEEALTPGLQALARQTSGILDVVPMDEQSIVSAIGRYLEAPSPEHNPVAGTLNNDAGKRTLDAILHWWGARFQS